VKCAVDSVTAKLFIRVMFQKVRLTYCCDRRNEIPMKHRLTTFLALTAVFSLGTAIADDGPKSDPGAGASNPPPREFAPMTRSERVADYAIHLADPAAVLSAAASAGIRQATNTPKEWGGGAEAYGDRIGSVFAQHVIQNTLMFGSSFALHEDNRYFVSGQSGFFRRVKYAVRGTMLARHDNGSQSISFSRIGGTAGAAFISRIWQPPSSTTAGDGAVSFGISMGSQIGFNIVREFFPDLKRRFHKK
jgi:hypothetical protein